MSRLRPQRNHRVRRVVGPRLLAGSRLMVAIAVVAFTSAAGVIGVCARLAPAEGLTGQQMQQQIEGVRQADSGVRIASFSNGAYAGKNVIVVQVEALNHFVIGRKYKGKPITPNLSKLIKTSWYFPNTYSETGAGNTADAEFIANTSLLAPVDRPASTTYSVRKIPALPRLLRDRGYATLTFHTNDVKFWNRREMYASLGFSRYYDRPFFHDEDMMWRSSDQVLFRRGAAAVRSAAVRHPVYAQFITITSHSPFRYPAQKKRRVIQVSAQDQKTITGRYVQAISYTDKAIGEFIAKLKRDGLYSNSIIVIYGDHTAMSTAALKAADKKFLKKLIGRSYNQSDIQRVGMIVHLPHETMPHLSRGTLGQVDIAPTIADLVGLDLSGTPHLGKSAFVDAAALVPMRSFLPVGSFINNSVVFKPQPSFDGGHAFLVSGGSPVTPSEQERTDFQRAAELGSLSEAWLNSLPRRPDAAAKQDRGF